MISFLLKKTFFDLWDNLLKIILINLGFLVSFLIPVLVFSLIKIPILGIFLLIAGILWCSVYISAAALSLKTISDYGSFGFFDFFDNLKTAWPAGLAFGFFVLLGLLALLVVIPFYIGTGSMGGLILGVFIFWALIAAILALQFFLAIRARLDTQIIKILKKCLFFFLGDTMFCIFLLIHNFFLLVLSIPLAFLFPGPAGLLLFLDEGLRLRLLKYDWMETRQEDKKISRRKIPWEEILLEEREKTGNRSLQNLIFPWKD